METLQRNDPMIYKEIINLNIVIKKPGLNDNIISLSFPGLFPFFSTPPHVVINNLDNKIHHKNDSKQDINLHGPVSNKIEQEDGDHRKRQAYPCPDQFSSVAQLKVIKHPSFIFFLFIAEQYGESN
jgi:hypothetical protein